MPWQDRYSVFAKRTTFHGFRELYESSSWWEKCLWIVIMGSCTGMLVWFIQIQTTQYLNGHTVTRITPLGGPPAFPPVWLRHSSLSSIDAEKLRQFGITPEEMQVAMSYLYGGLVYNSTIPMDTTKKSLWMKMRQHNISQIMQFFHRIALDAFDGSDSKNLVMETRHTLNVTSYLINLTDYSKMSFSDVLNLRFNFNFTTFWENARQLSPFLPNCGISQDPAMLRPVLFHSDNYIRERLEPEFMTAISTESTIYRRLGKCTNNRSIHEWYSSITCKLDCELRANSSVNATTCVPVGLAHAKAEVLEYSYFTKSFLGGQLSLCHLGMINATTGQLEGKEDPVFRDLASHEKEARDKEIATCLEECIPRCDQWRTTWSVTNLKYDFVPTEVAMVTVAFPDSSSLFVIEEIRQYEWHDLVSDFGGLVGLWLGASMMSLCQLIHLCCFSKNKMKKSSDTDPIARQMLEVLWLDFAKRTSENRMDIPRSRKLKRSKTQHASI